MTDFTPEGEFSFYDIKWEYLIEYIELGRLHSRLAHFGLDGWELCGVLQNRFIFKRPIEAK